MTLFVHAAPVSLAATEAARARVFPAPAVRHALLDGLVDPNAAEVVLDEAAYARFSRAVSNHVRGDERRIVLSCSIYNGFAPRLSAELRLWVERSDDAGARAALACGPRVGLAVSYPPSYRLIEDHLRRVAVELGMDCEPVALLTGNAFAYAGDARRYKAALLGAAAAANSSALDCIFLAQFSMDPFAAAVAATSRVPLVSALEATIRRLALDVAGKQE